MSDQVNHPSHYNSGKIEVIEALEDWGLNFHLANAVKYIARAGKKDPTKVIEDLEKAIWYIRRYIELEKAKGDAREPVKPDAMGQLHSSIEDARRFTIDPLGGEAPLPGVHVQYVGALKGPQGAK